PYHVICHVPTQGLLVWHGTERNVMTGSQIIIRQAEPSDAPAAVAMSVSSWRTAHSELLPAHLLNLTDQSREERGIAKWLEKGDVDAFVAEEAGQVIGFAMLRPSGDEPHGEA